MSAPDFKFPRVTQESLRSLGQSVDQLRPHDPEKEFRGTDSLGNNLRIGLSGLSAKANAPGELAWQMENPALTAEYTVRSNHDPVRAWGRGTGEAIAEGLSDPDGAYRKLLGKGPWISAAALGLGGAAIGGLGGLAMEKAQGQGLPWGKILALLAGGSMAGLGALASRGHTKEASSLSVLENALRADPELGTGERLSLLRALRSASPDTLETLVAIVRGAGRAGIGALIAKYLLRMGPRGQLLAAAAGAMYGTSRPSGRNALGERATPGRNAFGTRLWSV